MRPCVGVLAAAASAALLWGAPSPAQSREVEALHARGNALRAEHRDAAALEVFRGLWTRTQEPRALARMALAEAALAHWVDAEAHLNEALEHGTDAWIRQNRGPLQEQRRLIASHVGALDVRCAVRGAEVWINAARAGVLPSSRPLRVQAGQVTFDVRAPGYESVRRTVQITPGEQPTRAEVTLLRANDEPGGRAGAGEHVAPAPRSGGSPLTTLGVVSLVGAGIGIGVGAVGVVVRNDHVATFRDNHCLLEPYADAVLTRASGCRNEYALGNTWEAVSLAGFVAGGVLAVTGVVLLVVAPRRRDESPTAFRCGAGPGAVGISCGGAF